MLSFPAIYHTRKIKRYSTHGSVRRKKPRISFSGPMFFSTIYDEQSGTKLVCEHFRIDRDVLRDTIKPVVSEARSIFDLNYKTSDSSDGSDDGRYSDRQQLSDQINFLVEKCDDGSLNANLTHEEKDTVVAVINSLLRSKIELSNWANFLYLLENTITGFRLAYLIKKKKCKYFRYLYIRMLEEVVLKYGKVTLCFVIQNFGSSV